MESQDRPLMEKVHCLNAKPTPEIKINIDEQQLIA
jgi:hypothetical protein